MSVSVFLDSCGFNDQIQVAIKFWSKVLSKYPHILCPNAYTSMIEACGRCGDFETAAVVLKQFENSPLYLISSQEELKKLYQTYKTQITSKIAQRENLTKLSSSDI